MVAAWVGVGVGPKGSKGCQGGGEGEGTGCGRHSSQAAAEVARMELVGFGAMVVMEMDPVEAAKLGPRVAKVANAALFMEVVKVADEEAKALVVLVVVKTEEGVLLVEAAEGMRVEIGAPEREG